MNEVRNLLYRRPELYEVMYPEADEATPKLCLRLFERYIGRIPSSILDVACGTGRDLAVLARHCSDCVGIDISPEMVQFANSSRPHLKFKVGDMRAFRLRRTFDAVLCLGSALMYAHTDQDVDRTLETFRAHCHKGSLLVLDIRNAIGFLPGGCEFKERLETTVDSPGFTATAVSTHSFDRRNQRMIRRRTWQIPGEESVEDYCEYRMFFPAELVRLLTENCFDVLGMFDNKDLRETDLSGCRLYVAARYRAQPSAPADADKPCR